MPVTDVRLRLGLNLPYTERQMDGARPRWSGIAAIARLVEEIGLCAVWISDHVGFSDPASPEADAWSGARDSWTLLAALAAACRELAGGLPARFGVDVTYRAPTIGSGIEGLRALGTPVVPPHFAPLGARRRPRRWGSLDPRPRPPAPAPVRDANVTALSPRARLSRPPSGNCFCHLAIVVLLISRRRATST